MKETSSAAKVKRTLTQCKICTSPAIYSYVGVIVCASCKMFFKRNAQSKEFQCHFDGLCQITEKNRHLCGHCRMKKCLENGMQVDLLRNGRNRKIKSSKRSKTTPEQVRSLNPHAVLTAEQWNLLSNVVNSYDEYGQHQLAERFLYDQTQLPVKMRFKISSLHELLMRIMSAGPHLFRRNGDFLSLCPEDRSILLRKTLKQIVGLNCCYVTFSSKFTDNPALLETSEMLYSRETILYGIRTMNHLDVDPIFFKILLGVVMFSTSDQTDFTGESSSQFRDVKSILKIQNAYIELTWRYLLYRYNHQQAVRCYSNLIRTLFFLDQSISNATKTAHYNQTIEALIQQTEKTLRSNF